MFALLNTVVVNLLEKTVPIVPVNVNVIQADYVDVLGHLDLSRVFTKF